MQTLKRMVYLVGLILAIFISVGYRLVFLWRSRDCDLKRVLNYGSDLYALACKGNLNHVWKLVNPLRVFDKVFTVCSDPRSLQLDLKKKCLVPVLVSRLPWVKIYQLFNLCRMERLG